MSDSFSTVVTDPARSDSLVPVDPRRILGVLRRRSRVILAFAVLGAGIAAAVAVRAVAVYEATAVIRVRDARAAVSGGLTGERQLEAVGPLVDPILSLVEVLGSRGVAGTVVDSLPVLRLRTSGVAPSWLRDVVIKPEASAGLVPLEFWPAGVRVAGSGPTRTVRYGQPVRTRLFSVAVAGKPKEFDGLLELVPRDTAINALLTSLVVRPRMSTDIIDVRYRATDPFLAREVANKVVEVFRDTDADMARQISRTRREFLESQLGKTEADLEQTRKALAEFRTNARAYSARDRFASREAGMSALELRREDLDAQRRLYRTLLARLANPGGAGEGVSALLSSPGLSDNPVVQQIAAQLARYESERDSLTSGNYGSAASNPDVQRLNDLIGGARTRLAAAVRSVVTVLDERVAALDAARNRQMASFSELSGSEEREQELTGEVATAQRLAEQLRTEYQQATLAEAVDLGQVEVIDLAGPARRLGLSPLIQILLGLSIGLVAGCLAAVLTEYLTPSIRRQDDLSATLHAPGSIVIPRTLANRGKTSNGDRALVAMTDIASGGSEAYRALRTTLLFSKDTAGLKSLLITSALAGEGKSTVAANLAIVFAQQGVKVLLVDCDLRRARLHHMFHLQRVPGLTTLLSGKAQPAQAIRRTDVKNLSLLPAGAPPTNPAEIVGSPEMSVTLEYLVSEFDMVICDSPPLLAAADSSVLATLTEGVIMVVRAGRAEHEVVRMAKQQLATVGAKLVAAVLNDPDAEVKRYGGDYYFAGYGEKDSKQHEQEEADSVNS